MLLQRVIHRLVLVLPLMLLVSIAAAGQEKLPVIIVPGLTGSELINKRTNEVVWFKAPRSKDDDLRMPVTANVLRSRDDLVRGDILRSVKVGIFPRIDVYGGLVETLIAKAGYHEESWQSPTSKGDTAAIYVFPYDWRRDNVENARLLIHEITALKLKLKRPDLKFNVIAHSMGGIITRYAAMYGDADLPPANRSPKPTWAGARHFGKVVLLGTPNEGSVLALRSLVDGFSIGGIHINLPFVQDLSKFDLFTIPSAYQLLPAPGTLRVTDENFEPISIDLYDPKEWAKYGWSAIDDKGFPAQFRLAERRAAPEFFASALLRAKRLHEALAAGAASNRPGLFHIVGADCNDALDLIVLRRDKRTDQWVTMFKPASFLKNSGDKVTHEELKDLMLADGDGVVTKRSLETDTQTRFAGTSVIKPASSKFICEEHNKLAANSDIQNYLMSLFEIAPASEKAAK
ncbi:MAG: hypothetical protein K1X36_11905 [Pyrinomonadaceae bacterium]|nr:hypothetical protein [Pyrinomonadaceae bacterium]